MHLPTRVVGSTTQMKVESYGSTKAVFTLNNAGDRHKMVLCSDTWFIISRYVHIQEIEHILAFNNCGTVPVSQPKTCAYKDPVPS